MRCLCLLGLWSATAAAQPAETPVKLSLGGYLETYYQVNLRAPSNGITNLRGFDNRDRSLTLSNVALDVHAERGPVSAHVVLQYGATPSSYYLYEPTSPGTASVNASGPELWKYLQQANLAYTTSGKLVIDAGLFTSPIGPESIQVKDSWNWSRSNLFFGLPYYHAGARVAAPLNDTWTGQLHVYNGWNSVVDNNSYPSIAASLAFSTQRASGQLLYFGGIERPTNAPEGKPWRHLFDAYATVSVSDTASLGAELDVGAERNNFGTNTWFAAAVYGKFVLTPKLYAAVRGDYLHESVPARGSTLFFPTDSLGSATGTLAYQPASGLSLRLEVRHDQADDQVYFGGQVTGDGVMAPYLPNRRQQDTWTLGAVAWF